MANRTADNAIDHFLHESLRQRRTVEVFLKEGLRFTGQILGHDKFSILLSAQGAEYLLYKNSVTRVIRVRKGGPIRSCAIRRIQNQLQRNATVPRPVEHPPSSQRWPQRYDFDFQTEHSMA
jgi:RNA chaperone Hfq